MALYTVSQGGVINAADLNQYYNLLTGTTTDQPVTVSNRVRAQLSGATGGSGGYVGATTGGPPASGTFVAGDFEVDTLGGMWVCTTGGTPGTWQAAGWTRLATSQAGTTVASVSFTSIPATYLHLALTCQATGDTAANFTDVLVRFNNDTGTNYGRLNWIADSGAGTVTVSQATSQNAGGLFRIPAASLTSTHAGSGMAIIHHYSDATLWKTKDAQALSHSSPPWTPSTRAWFTTWATTTPTAINRIDLLPTAGNFIAGSYFTLYGIG